MGIRFRCPNGHKLHVKAFLAGKRGICPHCGEKFQIPLQSDPALAKNSKQAAGTVKTVPKAAEVSVAKPQTASDVTPGSQAAALTNRPSGPIPMQPVNDDVADRHSVDELDEASVTIADRSSAPAQEESIEAAPDIQTEVSSGVDIPTGGADPIDEAPHAVWYVRPPSGGQFGPASADVMRTWISEGRVTADSLVWREGWPEWKQAGPLFPGIVKASSRPSVSDVPQIVTSAAEASSAELYRRRKSNKSTLMVVFLLIIACLILFGALVYVVKFMN